MIARSASPSLVTAALFFASIASPRPAAAAPPRPDDALGCMTSAIYHEAAREPRAGQQAVAAVVLNRVAAQGFPKSVCGVIFEGAERRTGCQFSFTCDGAMRRVPDPALWANALDVAERALADPDAAMRVTSATDYHADYVRPYWAAAHIEVARLGRHIFYQRAGRAAPVAAQAAAGVTAGAPGVFTAWGIAIARVSPIAGGIRVEEAAPIVD